VGTQWAVRFEFETRTPRTFRRGPKDPPLSDVRAHSIVSGHTLAPAPSVSHRCNRCFSHGFRSHPEHRNRRETIDPSLSRRDKTAASQSEIGVSSVQVTKGLLFRSVIFGAADWRSSALSGLLGRHRSRPGFAAV
jgi:hypothetical protein